MFFIGLLGGLVLGLLIGSIIGASSSDTKTQPYENPRHGSDIDYAKNYMNHPVNEEIKRSRREW